MKVTIKKSSPVLLCLVILAVLVLYGFGQQVWKIHELNAELQELEAVKVELTAAKDSLVREAELLENDSYLLSLAREDFSMIFPGEKLYLPSAVDPEVKAKTGEAAEITP